MTIFSKTFVDFFVISCCVSDHFLLRIPSVSAAYPISFCRVSHQFLSRNLWFLLRNLWFPLRIPLFPSNESTVPFEWNKSFLRREEKLECDQKIFSSQRPHLSVRIKIFFCQHSVTFHRIQNISLSQPKKFFELVQVHIDSEILEQRAKSQACLNSSES